MRPAPLGSPQAGALEQAANQRTTHADKREQIGNHADPRDTSQMMAVDPTMVRNSKIVAADGKNGIQGDPRGSTAEIGRALIDKNMARTVDLIRQSIAAR